MKKKNLLFIVNQLHGGGAQKVTASLSRHLSPHYNVTLAIYNDTDLIVFPHGGELVKLKLPYGTDSAQNPAHKRAMRLIALYRQIRRLKRDRQIDICISFMEVSNIVNILTSRGERTILSVRSFLTQEFEDYPRLRILRPAIRWLYNRATAVVGPSQLLLHDLITRFGVRAEQTHLIYNYVDQEWINECSREPLPGHLVPLFRDFRVIINVGRITNPKAQWRLMGAFRRTLERFPDARLVILGEGPRQPRVLEAAAAEGLQVYVEGEAGTASMDEARVFLLGFRENPYPFLAASRVFIKSSVYEGFPNVIIEAMTCRLPVISTDCPSGPREILQPESDLLQQAVANERGKFGILTPSQVDDETYARMAAAALGDLLGDEELRQHYVRQSTLRATDFSRERILAQWRALADG